MTDPIADMITRLNNGYLARKQEVVAPYSKVKEAMAKLLVREQYLESTAVDDKESAKKTLVMKLRYIDKKPALTGVKRLSKPGLRRYTSAHKIPRSLGGYGVTIVSTSLGVLSDKEARAKKVGGELLCSIW